MYVQESVLQRPASQHPRARKWPKLEHRARASIWIDVGLLARREGTLAPSLGGVVYARETGDQTMPLLWLELAIEALDHGNCPV